MTLLVLLHRLTLVAWTIFKLISSNRCLLITPIPVLLGLRSLQAGLLTKLIEKTESLIQRMRWKAFFFLNTNTDDATTKETYGFKSKRSPPHVKDLEQFEDCMLDMIQSIQFKANHHPNNLQRKLRNDVKGQACLCQG